MAANQSDRADNVIRGTKWEQVEVIRKNIRDFKTQNGVEKVVVLWTANTERYAAVEEGLNDTMENLLRSWEMLEILYLFGHPIYSKILDEITNRKISCLAEEQFNDAFLRSICRSDQIMIHLRSKIRTFQSQFLIKQSLLHCNQIPLEMQN